MTCLSNLLLNSCFSLLNPQFGVKAGFPPPVSPAFRRHCEDAKGGKEEEEYFLHAYSCSPAPSLFRDVELDSDFSDFSIRTR